MELESYLNRIVSVSRWEVLLPGHEGRNLQEELLVLGQALLQRPV